MKQRNWLISKALFFPTTIMFMLMCTGANARIAFKDAPVPNNIQKDNFTFENNAGGLECKPKGAYAEIRNDPYKCYIELDDCKASYDALTGKLKPKHLSVLTNMVKLKKGSIKEFLGRCPGEDRSCR